MAPTHPATPRSRPDPTALRVAGAFTAVAAASAIVSAMLAPAPLDAAVPVAAAVAAAPESAVVHVLRVVTLQPGQTAPPQAIVQQQAAPQPKTVIVRTRQSGTK